VGKNWAPSARHDHAPPGPIAALPTLQQASATPPPPCLISEVRRPLFVLGLTRDSADRRLKPAGDNAERRSVFFDSGH
jgi:hypothetical protein